MSENTTDNVLSAFVEAANKEGFSLDISLIVGGAVISGTLVSAEEYFKEMSDTFKDGNDVAKEFSEQFNEASESVASNEDEVQNIHLKDANIHLADNKPLPSKGNVLWRGKLSSVDSFFLGKIKGSTTK